jgi:hypothetical protein
MNNTYSQAESRRIVVAAGAAVSVELSPGDTTRCVSGQIWLTQEDDWRDYCLLAGMSFCADRRGRAVLSAIGSTSIVVVQRYAGAAVRRMVPGTIQIDSIEALTRRARRARADWIAAVLVDAAAWWRARMRAASRLFRARRSATSRAG